MNHPKAVVFDLDGTLVDSAPDLHAAVDRTLLAHGRAAVTLEQVRGWVGNGARKLVERAFLHSGGWPDGQDADSLTAAFLDFYHGHTVDLTRLYPGVVDCLKTLARAGYRMGVCTNKPEQPTREILDGLGLSPWFAAVVGGDTLAVKKPDAAPLLTVLEELGVRSQDAVMVGDNPADVGAARGAETKVIIVSFGYCSQPVDQLRADALADDFAAIPDLVRRLIG